MSDRLDLMTGERDEARRQRDDYRRKIIELTGHDPAMAEPPRAECGCKRTRAGECVWQMLFEAADQSHRMFLDRVREALKEKAE